MGIGNAAVRIGPDQHQGLLITPHGDRKLYYNPTWMMGVTELITPHGDRKPAVAAQPLPDTLLITPHGDRKPWFELLAERLARVSLPLMGIGNPAAARASAEHCPSASLPLMGIGNQRTIEALQAWIAISLPLMGIGNHRRVVAGRGPAGGGGLITPHGDRKHRRRRGARRDGLDTELITPHGDRKPALSIGPAVPAHLGLITPHGDRKLGIALAGHAAYSPAHYPSWGSETSSASGAVRPRRSYSLPLMGIGNLAAVVWAGQPEVLITPHGDRKPVGSTDPAAEHIPHYPSWGSET